MKTIGAELTSMRAHIKAMVRVLLCAVPTSKLSAFIRSLTASIPRSILPPLLTMLLVTRASQRRLTYGPGSRFWYVFMLDYLASHSHLHSFRAQRLTLTVDGRGRDYWIDVDKRLRNAREEARKACELDQQFHKYPKWLSK